MRQARKNVADGHRWVVDLDLSKFFDRVNHDILMERLARRISDKTLLRLRVPSDLIDEYRDWSWKARCQLSELVGQALITYHKSHRRRQ